MTWLQTKGKRGVNAEVNFRGLVAENIDGVVKKAEHMACKHERSQVRLSRFPSTALPNFSPQDPRESDKPVQIMQTVTNLISMATNALKLAMMTDLYSPWF